ncbi:hypothetical protein RJ55_02828 [Drechmeria coniospora]|nr:hypothetical protein RJ55_02828 [Drechmeria coniospora]
MAHFPRVPGFILLAAARRIDGKSNDARKTTFQEVTAASVPCRRAWLSVALDLPACLPALTRPANSPVVQEGSRRLLVRRALDDLSMHR